jgi:hypothetical protein
MNTAHVCISCSIDCLQTTCGLVNTASSSVFQACIWLGLCSVWACFILSNRNSEASELYE